MAFSAAWILAGSVEPARSIASHQHEEALHLARGGIVHLVAALLLVHLGDDGGRRARRADAPRRAVEHALRDLADRLDEGRIGIAGIVGDHHRRLVVERLHGLGIQDRVRRVGDHDHDVGLLLLELQHLALHVGGVGGIGDIERDRLALLLERRW